MVLVLSNLPRLAGEMTRMRLLSRDPDARALVRVQSAPSRVAVPVSVRGAMRGRCSTTLSACIRYRVRACARVFARVRGRARGLGLARAPAVGLRRAHHPGRLSLPSPGAILAGNRQGSRRTSPPAGGRLGRRSAPRADGARRRARASSSLTTGAGGAARIRRSVRGSISMPSLRPLGFW